MKKTVSVLLAILMLASLCTPAFAEEVVFTPEIVIQRLQEGDDYSATADDQGVNGVYRLAEMLGTAAAVRATEEECEIVNGYLAQMYAGERENMSNPQMLALGAMQVFNILNVIAEQEDPQGDFDSNREEVVESFTEGDDSAESAVQQTVNALYHAVSMTTLIEEEICPTDDTYEFVEAEMNLFDRDDDACADANEQIVNGAYWLFRMLTAVVTTLSPNDSVTENVTEVSEGTTQEANNEPVLNKELVVWLYGCVAMSGVLAAEYEAEAE